MHDNKTFFAPMLYIKSGIRDVSFYEKAFGAVELKRWTNDDGSIHVVEFSIEGNLFHLHEEKPGAGQFAPPDIKGTTVFIGLFVSDVDIVVERAIQAGATVFSPVQSYDYGYRQGDIMDPFGHVWQIEKKI